MVRETTFTVLDGGGRHGNRFESGSRRQASCSPAEPGIFGYIVLVTETGIWRRSIDVLDGAACDVGWMADL